MKGDDEVTALRRVLRNLENALLLCVFIWRELPPNGIYLPGNVGYILISFDGYRIYRQPSKSQRISTLMKVDLTFSIHTV